MREAAHTILAELGLGPVLEELHSRTFHRSPGQELCCNAPHGLTFAPRLPKQSMTAHANWRKHEESIESDPVDRDSCCSRSAGDGGNDHDRASHTNS